MMYRRLHLPVWALLLAGWPTALAGQQAPSVTVSWLPEQAPQGSIVQLVVLLSETPVLADSVAPVRGRLGDQPLVFERTNRGLYRALGPVPVSRTERIPLVLEIGPLDNPVDRTVWIPVISGAFTVEQLTVAPAFATAPDSALAVRIADERAQARAVSRTALTTPRLWRGAFALPVAGRVTSPFGKGREFNGTLQSRHMGTDLSGQTGTPVYAANRGVVALTGDFYYAGRVVYVNHGAGLVTVYMHLSEIAVSEGDPIDTGQLIGRVGATGRVTGPHLHWTLRYGSVSVDPLSIVEQDLSAFASTAP
jgi:murein DD-endopeptidase MepM/ murein hydrolase activator NlpD